MRSNSKKSLTMKKIKWYLSKWSSPTKKTKWSVLYPTRIRILCNRKVKNHQRMTRITILSSLSTPEQKHFTMRSQHQDQLKQNAVLLRRVRCLTVSSPILTPRIVRSKEYRDRSRGNCNAMESKCLTIGASATKETSVSITLVNSSIEQPPDIYLRQIKSDWSPSSSTQKTLTLETCPSQISSSLKPRES